MRQALSLHQAGRRAEAETLYRQVLAARADHAAALHFLGLLLHQSGRGAEGLGLLQRSLRAQPANSEFLNNFGTVLRDLGQDAQAAEQFRKALALKPDNAAARDNLAATERRLGRLESAEALYRSIIQRNSFNIRARLALADTLLEAGRLDEAVAVFREAHAINPSDPEVLHGLGMAAMESGRLGEAADHFRRALAIAPAQAKSWQMLSLIKPQRERDAELAAMEGAYAAAAPDSPARMYLSFGLGKANDDLREYGRAFDFFEEGNRIRRATLAYDPERTRREFEAMKAVFSKAFFAGRRPSDIDDDMPIFVVGMPRSGTTLIEQIVSSHPDVHGAGELDVLKAAVGGSFPFDMKGGFPAGVAGMPDKAFVEAGRAYLSMLRKSFPGHRHVTDKMPGNFLLLGFVHMMLPKARIVHCARDAAATCLSIFKTNFNGDGHRYGYDLEELADFHNLYVDLMRHWHEAMPGVVHDVRYEDFVADQEGQTRALMDYLGLPWDERVLAFHESGRRVRTASVAQVRQPMYKGSVDLWKRYGDRLKPLIDRLEA